MAIELSPGYLWAGLIGQSEPKDHPVPFERIMVSSILKLVMAFSACGR